VAGARREAKLNTVNGLIRATFAELQKGVSVDVRTVNGGIALTLPARAGFHFEGDKVRAEHDKLRAEIREKQRKARKSDEGDDGAIDLSDLNEALEDLNREMAPRVVVIPAPPASPASPALAPLAPLPPMAVDPWGRSISAG